MWKMKRHASRASGSPLEVREKVRNALRSSMSAETRRGPDRAGPRKHALSERLHDERVVGGVQDSKAQHDVTDQRVVHECLTPGHQAGHAGLDQPRLEPLPDRVIAVQHRVLAPGQPDARRSRRRSSSSQSASADSSAKHLYGDAVLGFAVGLQPLLEQAGIAGDQPPRGLEDLAGAAAIQVENDRRVDAEVGPEAFQDRGVGAGPGEDGLLVVAHGEEVPWPAGAA